MTAARLLPAAAPPALPARPAGPRPRARAALLALPLLLAGCAGRPPAPVYTNPVLPAHWEAEGKAAVRSAERGTNLYFTWTQHGADYRLVVRGPLGLGHAELNGRPGAVRLQADGLDREVSASSPEELVELLTRRRAPVSNAMHWIKAEPASPGARIQRDAQDRPVLIEEGGWTVRYLEWSEEAPRLPRRLTVEGPDGRATVVVGQWRLDLAAGGETGFGDAPPGEAGGPAAGNGAGTASGSGEASGGGAAPAATGCCRPRDPATVLPLAPIDKLPDPGL